MSDIKTWLDQVEARLDAVRREPAQEDRDYDKESQAWSDLYENAPNDLEFSTQLVRSLLKVIESHPEPDCDKYSENEVISCGWKSAYSHFSHVLLKGFED